MTDPSLGTSRPLVVAHRGASGYRPEHTLAGYELAARMGADFIEPDLVSTADGVLVARHEPEIGATTDVSAHPEFADRHTTRTIDGRAVAGWFVEDFTAAEMATLRAVERIPQVRRRNTLYDGRYRIPTFDEILALRARLSDELGRPLGVYPETKHPSYFGSIGLPLEPPLVDALERGGLNRPGVPVFVQSFETANLVALRSALRVGLVQLVDAAGAPADLVAAGDPRSHAELVTPAGLAAIARYADAIGPAKQLLDDGVLIDDAHAAGLAVHAWTFRNENRFLPPDLRRAVDGVVVDDDFGDAFGEYVRYFDAGVDAVFTDHPDTAIAVRSSLLARTG